MCISYIVKRTIASLYQYWIKCKGGSMLQQTSIFALASLTSVCRPFRFTSKRMLQWRVYEISQRMPSIKTNIRIRMWASLGLNLKMIMQHLCRWRKYITSSLKYSRNSSCLRSSDTRRTAAWTHCPDAGERVSFVLERGQDQWAIICFLALNLWGSNFYVHRPKPTIASEF